MSPSQDPEDHDLKEGSALLGFLVVVGCWLVLLFLWFGDFKWFINLFITDSDLEGY